MSQLVAEVIAIGDELTSGQRLNTNSQWISRQLADCGVHVAYHTTVGDKIDAGIEAFKTAISRSDIVVSTGGLGPTEDDLTREVIARVAGVELVLDHDSLEHIKKIFKTFSREMPEKNEVQAYVPLDSTVISNPHGTAPGIDFATRDKNDRRVRLFALPGVSAELHEMWELSVAPVVKEINGPMQATVFHTLHCFGAGESEIEAMISPEVMKRGRDPEVGITASDASVTLQVSTSGESELSCREKLEPTVKTIRANLGPLVYGENEQQLQDAVIARMAENHRRFVVVDLAFEGRMFQRLRESDGERNLLIAGIELTSDASILRFLNDDDEDRGEVLGTSNDVLEKIAHHARQTFHSDMAVVVGRLPTVRESLEGRMQKHFFKVSIAMGELAKTQKLAYAGHPAIMKVRAMKQVLNLLRSE